MRVSLPDADVDDRAAASAPRSTSSSAAAACRATSSRAGSRRAACRSLGRRTAWHAVPADLARRKERAEAFHAAWRRWMGKGELVYCHGADPRGRDLAVQASGVAPLETQRRRIWR